MTRTEFTSIFPPMVKALQVKMLPAQVEYFWEAYGSGDRRDFAHACRELGMGTPGYLPKVPLFQEYIGTAREMRLERESQAFKLAGERFMSNPPTKIQAERPEDEVYGARFAKCCYEFIKNGAAKREATGQFIEEQCQDPGFKQYLATRRGECGMVYRDWFAALLRGEIIESPRPLHPSIHVWTKKEHHEVELRRLEWKALEGVPKKNDRSRRRPYE